MPQATLSSPSPHKGPYMEQERPEIAGVRYRIFRWTIYPFLIFGLISLVLGSLQAYSQGQVYFSIIYIASYLIFFLMTIAGQRIDLKFRSVALVVFLSIIALSVLVRIGLSGVGLVLMLLACELASIMLGRRVGFF